MYIIKDIPENLGVFIPHPGLTEESMQRIHPTYVKFTGELTESIMYYRWDNITSQPVLKDNYQDLKDADILAETQENEIQEFDKLKLRKIKEIGRGFSASSKRPQVDTTLGYSVDGSHQDLQNFQTALALNATVIRDADNQLQTVTDTDLGNIIQKIQENGSTLYQRKWDLDAAIKAATTVGELEVIVWGPDEI